MDRLECNDFLEEGELAISRFGVWEISKWRVAT